MPLIHFKCGITFHQFQLLAGHAPLFQSFSNACFPFAVQSARACSP